MKKLLLFCCLLPLAVMAQIGPIQTQEKPHEFISGKYLFRTVATDEYTLQITSDNQFENTAVHLSLGHGASEAMSSLSSLYAVYQTPDQQFTLQGYTFYVQKQTITALHQGPLEYTAGYYTLYKRDLATAMCDLMTKKELEVGEVSITYYGTTAVFIQYKTYGFEHLVNLNNVKVPYSRAYNKGDVIEKDDIILLKKVAENPNAYRGGEKRGALVHDKNELIRICDLILQAEVVE